LEVLEDNIDPNVTDAQNASRNQSKNEQTLRNRNATDPTANTFPEGKLKEIKQFGFKNIETLDNGKLEILYEIQRIAQENSQSRDWSYRIQGTSDKTHDFYVKHLVKTGPTKVLFKNGDKQIAIGDIQKVHVHKEVTKKNQKEQKEANKRIENPKNKKGSTPEKQNFSEEFKTGVTPKQLEILQILEDNQHQPHKITISTTKSSNYQGGTADGRLKVNKKDSDGMVTKVHFNATKPTDTVITVKTPGFWDFYFTEFPLAAISSAGVQQQQSFGASIRLL
jgi:hypothetical protein